MARTPNVRWIDIAEVMERAKAGSILDDFGAAALLEQGFKSGKLRARARKIELVGPKLEPIGIQPSSDADGFTLVPPSLFANGEFSENFFEDLLFEKAICFGSNQTVASFSGLQVHLKDFDKLMRDTLAWDASGVMRGRPRSEKAWLQFILTVVELEREGLLTEREFPNAATLKKTIADELGVSGRDDIELDERTYGPYVDGLWTILVRGHKPPA